MKKWEWYAPVMMILVFICNKNIAINLFPMEDARDAFVEFRILFAISGLLLLYTYEYIKCKYVSHLQRVDSPPSTRPYTHPSLQTICFGHINQYDPWFLFSNSYFFTWSIYRMRYVKAYNKHIHPLQIKQIYSPLLPLHMYSKWHGIRISL